MSAADCLAVEDSPTGALAAERAGAGVLVVPCEEPVPGGPGRVLRASLAGMTAADFRDVYASARARACRLMTAGPGGSAVRRAEDDG